MATSNLRLRNQSSKIAKVSPPRMASNSTRAVPTGPIENVSNSPSSPRKLEDQAAAAALYATHPERSTKKGYEFLDSDNKLSSAGAAASLKYANPQDLPSFPSAGSKSSAAGAAASLGWAQQKPFEHWKPENSEAAAVAAFRAKDYKMAPIWQPEQSANSARAAVLAHRDGGKLDLWQPEPSAWGNTAAVQAMKLERAGALAVELDYGHTAIGRKGSMLAATGAMSNSRKRAESNPIPVPQSDRYPDEANAAANALSAATHASASSRRKQHSSEIGAVPYTNMAREMFTSNPLIGPELEEQSREGELHASAVTMAKKIYNQQQMHINAAAAAHGRRSSSSSDEVQPMRFNNLQEAAQKLAQERLAKLHDEHAQAREYRDYYHESKQSTTSKLLSRGRMRTRASSMGGLSDDREQSNKIRAQMSLFSSNLSQVDEKKRQQDREALIATAQRNVTKRLSTMDQQVFNDTGKIGPSLLDEWELKAHAAAQAKSDARMENYGKVNIGGGKFVDQSAVDAVASKNVQPVIDEINEKAETERQRKAELKAQQDNEKRIEEERKAREKETKEINKKLKQQDRDEEKSRKAEEKRLAKEKRRSGGVQKPDISGPATVFPVESEDTVPSDDPTVVTGANVVDDSLIEHHEASSTAPAPSSAPPETQRDTPVRTSIEEQVNEPTVDTAQITNHTEVSSPKSSKAKNWIKSKFRRTSKSQKSPESKDSQKGFIGGAALTGASANNSTISLEQTSVPETKRTQEDTSAIESPIFAETATTLEPSAHASSTYESSIIQRGRPTRRASDVSTASSLSRDDEFQEARDNFDEGLAPPPTFAVKPASPVRDSKFHEVMDES